jgi:hypothetical protein
MEQSVPVYCDEDVANYGGSELCGSCRGASEDSMSIQLALVHASRRVDLEEACVDRAPNHLLPPETYRHSCVFACAVPEALLGGSIIVGIGEGTKECEGQLQRELYPSLIDPVARQVGSYVAEETLERVDHGRRADVLTVTHRSNLDPIAEMEYCLCGRPIVSTTPKLQDIAEKALPLAAIS